MISDDADDYADEARFSVDSHQEPNCSSRSHGSDHFDRMFSYQDGNFFPPCAPSDCKGGRGGSQRHHGARLKVKVNQSVCDGAEAAGGGARSHLVLLKSQEVALKGKQEENTLSFS